MNWKKKIYIDDGIERWEALLSRRKSWNVFHDPAFFSLLEGVYKCRATPLVISSDGKSSGLPAFAIRNYFSGKKVTTGPFNFYPGILGEAEDSEFFARLIERAQTLGPGWYVEYKTLRDKLQRKLSGWPIVQTTPFMLSTLPIVDSYDGQAARYRKKLRKNIRNAYTRVIKENIVFRRATQKRDIKNFYRLLCRLYRDKHRMICQPYQLYEELFLRFGPEKCSFYLAQKDGQLLAGVVVLKNSDVWDYCWGASSSEHQGLSLNTLLVDQVIQDAVKARVASMSFGCSSPSDEKLLYFKERWGCSHQPVYYYYWNHHPNLLDYDSSFPLFRRGLRFMPLSLLRVGSRYAVPQLV